MIQLFLRRHTMITIDIPGYKVLELKNAVFDYNGTLATDGGLNEHVREKLAVLADKLNVHILTADTFQTVRKEIQIPGIEISVIGSDQQTEQKAEFIKNLGCEHTAAIGNGANDILMLQNAALGICVIGNEGACSDSVTSCSITVYRSEDAIDLLLNPDRIKATLRR
jgi:soluble P-type ATPase